MVDKIIIIGTVESRYNVPRLQRIHPTSSQVPISRKGKISVWIQRTIVRTYFFPTPSEYVVTRLSTVVEGNSKSHAISSSLQLNSNPNDCIIRIDNTLEFTYIRYSIRWTSFQTPFIECPQTTHGDKGVPVENATSILSYNDDTSSNFSICTAEARHDNTPACCFPA